MVKLVEQDKFWLVEIFILNLAFVGNELAGRHNSHANTNIILIDQAGFLRVEDFFVAF